MDDVYIILANLVIRWLKNLRQDLLSKQDIWGIKMIKSFYFFDLCDSANGWMWAREKEL